MGRRLIFDRFSQQALQTWHRYRAVMFSPTCRITIYTFLTAQLCWFILFSILRAFLASVKCFLPCGGGRPGHGITSLGPAGSPRPPGIVCQMAAPVAGKSSVNIDRLVPGPRKEPGRLHPPAAVGTVNDHRLLPGNTQKFFWIFKKTRLFCYF